MRRKQGSDFDIGNASFLLAPRWVVENRQVIG